MDGIEEIFSVPVITALVYVAMVLYKSFVNGNEAFVRLIPSLTLLLGCLLGAIIFYVAPELMPASNVFMAILIGAGSGLAATGTHQIFKQLMKMDQDPTTEQDKTDEESTNESSNLNEESTNEPSNLNEESTREE